LGVGLFWREKHSCIWRETNGHGMSAGTARLGRRGGTRSSVTRSPAPHSPPSCGFARAQRVPGIAYTARPSTSTPSPSPTASGGMGAIARKAARVSATAGWASGAPKDATGTPACRVLPPLKPTPLQASHSWQWRPAAELLAGVSRGLRAQTQSWRSGRIARPCPAAMAVPRLQ
jgi:hypothetical protein